MTSDRRRRSRARRALAVAALLAGAVVAGCGKQKESLVVVALTTDTPTASPSRVTLTVGTLERTFTVPSLSSTPTSLGVYLPESVTGMVTITAAVEAGSCAGYDGTAIASVGAAGATVGAAITLQPKLLCTCTELDHRDSSAPTCDLTASPKVGDTYITGVAFSADGKYFVSAGDDGRAKVWRFDGAGLTPEGHVLPVDGGGKVAFSPDGKLLAVVSWSAPANPVAIYDVPSFTLHRSLTGATDNTIDVGFTPDSQHVIVLESDNLGSGSLDSFSLVSGNVFHGALGGLEPITLSVSKVVASAGIQIAVSAADGRAGVFTYATTGFSAPSIFQVTSSSVTAWTVAFSPDGSLVAAGGEDGAFNLWAAPFTPATATGPALIVGADRGVNQLAFSPDGAFVGVAAGTQGREVSFWNVGSRARLAAYTPAYGASQIAFSPDGHAAAGGELYCGNVFICK